MTELFTTLSMEIQMKYQIWSLNEYDDDEISPNSFSNNQPNQQMVTIEKSFLSIFILISFQQISRRITLY